MNVARWMRILVVAVALSMCAQVAWAKRGGEAPEEEVAEEESEFRQDIRKLMELTGSKDIGMQVIEQMIGMFRQSYTHVPAEFWDEFIAAVDPDELVNLVVPIYERHLTHEDVKVLIEFYSTPTGRKLIAAQPQIVEESMLAGQTWGTQLGEEVVRKLQEQGY